LSKIKLVVTRIGCKVELMAFLEGIKSEEIPSALSKELEKLSSFIDFEENTLIYFFQGTTFVERAKSLLFNFSKDKKISIEVTE